MAIWIPQPLKMTSVRYIQPITVGSVYDRPTLARLWGHSGYQAFSRGVFTPANTNLIFLFVTREKQSCLMQYQDFLDGDLLFWEGESGHRSDNRIAAASAHGEEIHLFYRMRHHESFTYHGKIILATYIPHNDRPTEFVFKVAALTYDEASATCGIAAEPSVDDYQVLSNQALNSIDRQVVATTRGIAQHIFRGNLLKMWNGACAVTGVHDARVLRAGHIKPWSASSVDEKIDRNNGLLLVPDLDALFEEGLITFQSDGTLQRSPAFDPGDQQRMRIRKDFRLRQVSDAMQPYLEYHRECRFIA